MASAYDVVMQTRVCGVCQRQYRVLETSKQIFCNSTCKYLGEAKCQDQEKLSNVIVLGTESVSVRLGKPTQSTAYDKEPGSKRTKKRSMPKPESVTNENQESTLLEVQPTQNETELESIKPSEIGISELNQSDGSISSSTDSALILHTGSTSLFPNLNEEVSRSMNFLSDTGQHLFDLMKKSNPPVREVSNEIRLADIDRVHAAAECGKQIISTMRMQLDILKFAKELKESK